MGLRPSHLLIAAAACGGTLTLLAALGGAYAVRDDALHVGIEFFAALVACMAALLVAGRFREHGRLGDLTLAFALGLLAVASFAFSAIPAIGADSSRGFATWAPLVTRLLGAAALAASPFLLDRIVANRKRAGAIAVAVLVVLLVVIGTLVAGAGTRLPAGVAEDVTPGAFEWSRDAHVALLAAQLATAVLFLVAAVGFVFRRTRGGDPFLGWLGPAALLAAFAYVNYLLFPSLYAPSASIGDAFRVGFYLLVLAGATREVAMYQRERTESAVLEERRRLARDLHDGLAQELAFLVTQTRLLAMRHPRIRELEPIAATAQRALEESRLAIAALTRVGYEPLEVAVAAAAEEIAERAGVGVRLELAGGTDVPPELKEAMVRIVREAVTNAVRHGHADEVTVELENDNGIRLAIVDTGAGFDLNRRRERASGFGLTSMRERAEAVGGTFTVVSEPGAGTRVEVAVP
jgi:signal transduction histidine kinase